MLGEAASALLRAAPNITRLAIQVTFIMGTDFVSDMTKKVNKDRLEALAVDVSMLEKIDFLIPFLDGGYPRKVVLSSD